MTEWRNGNYAPALEEPGAVSFGPFQLKPRKRILTRNGQRLTIGDRAFDILVTLVERAGQVVTKEELLARAWPQRVVEEVNLRIHIAALRKVLRDGQSGERYIVNIIGRGYAFIANVAADSDEVLLPPEPDHRLPSRLTHLVGRSREIDTLCQLIAQRRIITLIGAGGMGKSALAVTVASARASAFTDGAYFVDLASVSDAGQLSHALARAIGVSVQASDPVPALVRFIKDKQMLIVLDNCEHLAEAVAIMVDPLLRHANRLHVLATSREPLRIEGEYQHRLDPLDMGHAGRNLDVKSASRIASIELFVERAQGADQSFELDGDNVATVASICRQLDGIPLAIELAAARTGQMTIEHLAQRLKEQFLLDSAGTRTGVAHHQTLRSTLDWSFTLLSTTERIVLQRLSIIRGAFTFGFGLGICARDEVDEESAARSILSLLDRSLVSLDVSGTQVLHRLLYTTRTYAFDKLMKSADAALSYQWHCQQVGRLMRQAELDWTSMSRGEWLASYEFALEDLRAALDWAMGCNGDVLLGASVTASSIPFGFQLALTEEFRDRTEQALCALSSLAGRDSAVEARLTTGLVSLSRHLGEANDQQRAGRAWSVPAGPLNQQMNFLVSRTVAWIESGEYEQALECARQLNAWAESLKDPAAILVARRLQSQAEHFCGNHAASRQFAEWVLDSQAPVAPLSYMCMPVDHRVSMRIILARVQWLEGYADQAQEMARRAVAFAEEDNAFSLCQALALAACPVAFWRGDDAESTVFTDRLIEHATRYRLDRWRCYGALYAKAGTEMPFDPLPGTSGAAGEPGTLIAHMVLTFGLTAAISANAEEPHLAQAGWCAPELMRLSARRSDLADGSAEAEAILRQALELAQQQNALAWQLRTAIDLAALWRDLGRASEALGLLRSVVRRFTEGHKTRDMLRARTLLQTL